MTHQSTSASCEPGEIIATAFEAAAGTRSWKDACEVMCREFGVWGVQLLGLFPESGALAFSFMGGQMTPQASLDYVTRHHAISPRGGLTPYLGTDVWVHDQDHLDESFVATDPFNTESLISRGRRRVSTTKLIDENGVAVLLCLYRSIDDKPMSGAQVTRVERVRDGLIRALRMHLARNHARPLSVAGRSLLELMPLAVMVVDEMRAISYRNQSAEGMLKRGDLLLDRHGFVDCPTAAGSQALVALIRSLDLGGAALDGTGLERSVVRLPSTDCNAGYLVLALAVRPERTMGAFGYTACAVLIVHPLDTPPSLDPFMIGFSFGLTPAEATVAAAIAQGNTPEEVARARGVSLATIRSQLRTVFDKVGVSRQVDLVRTLLELPRFFVPSEEASGKVPVQPSKSPKMQ